MGIGSDPVGKRPFQENSSNAKRPRFDPKPTTMFNSNQFGGQDVPRQSDDDDFDKFVMTQDDEIQRLEEESRKRFTVREAVPDDIDQRPNIGFTYTEAARQPNQNNDLGSDYYENNEPTTNPLKEEMDRLKFENRRLEHELRTLKSELQSKIGETAILREKKTLTERENIKLVMEKDKAERQHKAELEKITDQYERQLRSLKTDLEFTRKENKELAERGEKWHKIFENNGLPAEPGPASQRSSPAVNRTNRQYNGPTFPDRRSFYNGPQLDRPIKQEPMENDFHTPIMHGNYIPRMEPKKELISVQHRCVQTDKIPPTDEIVKKLNVKRLITEKKPIVARIADQTDDAGSVGTEGRQFGEIMKRMMAFNMM